MAAFLLLIACAHLTTCLGLNMKAPAAVDVPADDVPSDGPSEMDAEKLEALSRHRRRRTMLPTMWDIEDKDPRSLVAKRDTCTGCDFTVDLRCDGLRHKRDAVYHRIADCLVPMYGMIQLARNVSSNTSTNVCALTWWSADGLDLSFFLKEMVDIKWHALIEEHHSCVRDLKHIGYLRTYMQGATDQWIEAYASDKRVVGAYSIDVGKSLPWLQRDVQHFVGERSPLSPLFITIQREGASRQFTEKGFRKLQKHMGAIKLQGKGLPQWIYRGSESMADTVGMFSRAAVVLGYHGGGFANTFFSGNRNCLHQISTTKDLDGKQQWRVNTEVKANALAKFSLYNISLATLLQENDVDLAHFEQAVDKDKIIKDLPFVPLRNEDVMNLHKDVRNCLDDWVEGHWSDW